MKQRIISSILGLGLLAAVLALFDTFVLNFAISIVCLMAMFEFLSATKIRENKLLSLVSYITVAIVPFIPMQKEMDLLPMFLLPYICLLFCILLKTHSTTRVDHIGLVFMTSLGIPLSLSTAVYIRDQLPTAVGIFYVLVALGGAWLSDSGAYFVGRAFGKHKMCPKISPNKTIEGAVGGLVTCVLLYGVMGLIFQGVCAVIGFGVEINYLHLLMIAPFASLISIVGDLSASIIKRQYDVKDFGNIMPGHGGVLDRFDSVLFVVPFVYVMTKYFPVCIVL